MAGRILAWRALQDVENCCRRVEEDDGPGQVSEHDSRAANSAHWYEKRTRGLTRGATTLQLMLLADDIVQLMQCDVMGYMGGRTATGSRVRSGQCVLPGVIGSTASASGCLR